MGTLATVMQVLPWAAWVLAAFAVVAALAARPLCSVTGSRSWVNALLVVSFGLVVALTLTQQDVDASLLVHHADASALSPLFRQPWQWSSPQDRLLNIAMFIPLGCAVALVGRTALRRGLMAAALLLPFAVEGIQWAVGWLKRDPQWQDVVDNTIGVLIGIGLGLALRWALRRWVGQRWQTPPVPSENSHRKKRRWPSIKAALVALAIVVAIIGLATWLGTSWMDTYRQAQAVQADVTALRADVSAKDWAAVNAGVPGVHASVSSLVQSTDGTQWQLLSATPFVGATGSAVRELALALDEVLVAAEPLTPYAERIVARDVRTADGAIDLAAMQQVAPLVQGFADALDSAAVRLSLVDTGAVLTKVADPIGEFGKALAVAAPSVAKAADVVKLVPSMLGADGPRNWLVLLQNPAEARGSGGFVGGYVIVTADGGRVRITSSGTSGDLATTPIPADGAPAASQALWGNMLQAWNTYNMGPNFPTNAELSVAGMNARGTPVTGVIAVDPSAVAALLTVTGPITAEGVTITAENVEQYFTVDIYSQIPDDVERDRVSMALVQAVFTEFLAAEWDPVAMIDAIRGPASHGGIQAWSADADEETRLANSAVGGVLPDSAGSVVAVAFNNAAANKMDAFVKTKIDYSPGRCVTEPVQNSRLQVTVRNEAPANLPDNGSYGRLDDPTAPAGSTNTLVHIYAPVGANFVSATIDGKDAPLYLGSEFNRPVWWTYLPTERGQERVIDVTFTEPMVLGVAPKVLPQSMLVDEVITVTPDPTC